MASTHHKVVILGSGPAGLTAAIYLSRANLHPVVFSGPQPGGQLTTTTDVGNFPGFIDDIPGPELMDRMRKQASRYGTEFVEEEITDVDFLKVPFTLQSRSHTVTADAVILATGASARWLGLESEQALRGKGVSACATCDGFFFKEKDVVIVGGGDTALEEATFLTKFAKFVILLHRGDALAGSTFMQERVHANEKIKIKLNSEVVTVLGTEAVTGVRVKNNKTGETEEIPVQGMFVAIGHKPNTNFLKGKVELEKGYIKVTDHTKTSVPGVFAGGDVHDWRYRQAVTAAGFGCMASLDVEKYLSSKD